jgi:predicted DsbA family dithiol-disulfide isomerase
MDTQLIQAVPSRAVLELDLIADLACPWSFLGKRSLERALLNLYGTPVRALRWHGFRGQGETEPPKATSWQDHLATRLPNGVTVDFAHRSLAEAGHGLGINFDFSKLTSLPDTREAHRLVKLAGRDERQSEVADALFGAFFEQGRDITDLEVLASVGARAGLTPVTLDAFRNPAEGRDDVTAEERRLRGLGVTATPNLLINGRILVPGPADVSTYVQALDQALFPELPAPQDKKLLH